MPLYKKNSQLDIMLIKENLLHIADKFDQDIHELYNFEKSVEQYKSIGGTARQSVKNQLEHFKTVYKLFL